MDALSDRDDTKPSGKRSEDKALSKSPKTRDQERERFVATPTDFAMDYGKGHPNSASFDTSNGRHAARMFMLSFSHMSY